jgi:hypothetical protein
MKYMQSIWVRAAVASVACVVLTQAAQAAVFRVRGDAPAGGDGLSWATAINTIDAALTAASAVNGSDDIWIARGVYIAPTLGWNTGDSNLYGGFAGTETLLSERNIAANETRLTGDVLGNDVPLNIQSFINPVGGISVPPQYTDNRSQILNLSGTLDGFTVGGVRNGVAASVNTGGIIRNCLFRDNIGGAILASGVFLRVENSTFVRGVTSQAGAAIQQPFVVVPPPGGPGFGVYNCRFHENYAFGGGAVSILSGPWTVANCLFTGNIAYSKGAAITVNVTAGTGPMMPINIVANTITRNLVIALGAATPANPVGTAISIAALRPGQTCNIRSSIVSENLPTAPPMGLDIAKSSTLSPTATLRVDACLATVQSTITNSGVISNVPAGIESLAGADNIVGTMDDGARLLPKVTPCTDAAPASYLPKDDADLDRDGNFNEPLPIDLYGRPREYDDPAVNGTGGNTLDIGCAEEQGFANDFVTSTAGDTLAGDVTVQRLFAGASAALRSSGTGVATLTATRTGLPAILISSTLTLQRVVLSTPGDVWIGDRDGPTSGEISVQGADPAGAPVLTARFVDVRQSRGLNFGPNLRFATSAGVRVSPLSGITISGATSFGGGLENLGNIQFKTLESLSLPGGGLTMRPSTLSGDPKPSVSITASPATSSSVVAEGPLRLAGSLALEITGFSSSGPPIGQSWTLLSGTSRTGTFDSAFLPGWSDRLTRLVYNSSSRSATVTAQVESRDNVIAFEPPIGFPIPGSPAAAAVGKLHAAPYPNPDLAVVVPDPSKPTGAPGLLYVLINLGATATSWNGYAAVTITKATGIDPAGVFIADFDGDGRNDIAVTNRSDDTIRLYYNDGADDFPTFTNIATADRPSGIAAGDLDGDGDQDLAVACASTGPGVLRIFLNTGGVMIAQPDIALGSNPTAVTIADLDGADGPDIAVADTGDDRAAVLLNAGSPLRAWGGFRPVRFFATGDEPSSIQPGNIDNGKETALALTNFASGTVTVLRPPPAGSANPQDFTPTSGAIGASPRSVAWIDVDNDGSDDIVAVADNPTTLQPSVRVLTTTVLPDGGLQFNQSPDAPTASEPSLVLRADLNSDGRPDIVTVGPETVAARTGLDSTTRGPSAPSNISAVLSSPPCPADLVADGVVNTTDLVFFLGRFGQTPTPGSLAFRADFNGDGSVNTADLVFFLGRFGRTCP